MTRFLLFVAGLVTVMAHPELHGLPKCGRVMHGGLECCKSELPKTPRDDDIKECFQLPKKPPPSCELEICIANKKGTASEDGTVDKKAMTTVLEKTLGSNENLFNNIKDNCIDGDVSKYGPKDMCDLMKIKLCTDIQMIMSCEEWSDEGSCKGMKELAQECVAEFS